MKIIKITASWCPSCLIMNSIFSEIKDELNIDIIEYDFDIDMDIVSKYNVGTILPVLIKLDENDIEIKRITGEHTKKEIQEFIEG